MRKPIWQIAQSQAELFVVGGTFAIAVYGLLYFNWLIAVSRFALPR